MATDAAAQELRIAQEKKDMELLWEPFGGYPFQPEIPAPPDAGMEYDPITMSDAELDLYLRTRLEAAPPQDEELQLAALQRDGAVPDPAMRQFLSAVILLDQTLPTEELVQQLEALRADMESPAALYLTEKLLLQLETQTRQEQKWEQKQKELKAHQAEAQTALAAARQNRQEAERRYRENSD